MFFSMNEEKKMRSRAAGGLFANLKGRCEVLCMTGWDQKGSFVPYAPYRNRVKFSKW